MSEGIVAGHLEVPVESDTKGFAKKLKAKIEGLAKGVVAEVGVDINDSAAAKKKLRAKLKAVVEEAAAGVSATVEVKVDRKQAKKAISKAVSRLDREVAVRLGVEVDGGLAARVAAEREAAEAETRRNPIRVALGVFRDRFRREVREAVEAAQEEATAAVDQTNASRGSLFSRMLGRFRRGEAAEAADDARDEADDAVDRQNRSRGSLLERMMGGGGSRSGGKNYRSARMGRMILGLIALASLVQPAVAAIGGGLGGLAAMLANLATSLQTVMVAPGLFLSIAAAVGAGIIAFTGWSAEGDAVVKSMARLKDGLLDLGPAWADLTKQVRSTMWDRLADPILNVAERLLPHLRTGLVGVTDQLSLAVLEIVRFAGTGEFLRQFNGQMSMAAGTTGTLGRLLGAVFEWLFDVSEATLPLQARMNKATDAFSLWLKGVLDSEEARQSFAEDLDYAADKLSQLGRILRSAWGVIKGTFLAGRPAGDTLLDDLESWLTQLDYFVNNQGSGKIKRWFDDMVPIARELGEMITAVGTGLAELAQNPQTAALLDQITNELGPALMEFLEELGDTLGPQVVTLITELVEVLSNLSEAGSPLATALSVVNDGLEAVNGFLEANPGFAEKLGVALAAILAFKALNTGFGAVSGVLKGFSGALGGVASRIPQGPRPDGGTDGGAAASARGTRVYWTGAPLVTALAPGAAGAAAAGAAAGAAGAGGAGTPQQQPRGRLARFGSAVAKPFKWADNLLFGGLGGALVGGVGYGARRLLGRGSPLDGLRARTLYAGDAVRREARSLRSGVGGSLRMVGDDIRRVAGRAGGAVRGAAGGVGRRMAGAAGSTAMWWNTVRPRGDGGFMDMGRIGQRNTQMARGATRFAGRAGMAAGRGLSKVPGLGLLVSAAMTPFQKDEVTTQTDYYRSLGQGEGQAKTNGWSDRLLDNLTFGGWGAGKRKLNPEYDKWYTEQFGTERGGLEGGIRKLTDKGDEVGASIAKWIVAARPKLEEFKTTIKGGVGKALDEVEVFKRDAEGKITGVNLAAPGQFATSTLVNSLPPGVQDALTNLGIFKTDADGRTRVDLAGTASFVGSSLANALPGPVQTALTNLGVFKTGADGRTRIDLSGVGGFVGGTLARALPAPVSTALTNLGVFKTGADGRVRVDLSSAGSWVAGRFAGALPDGVATALKNLGVFRTGAAGQVDIDLFEAGKKIVGSLARGILGGVTVATSAMSTVAAKIMEHVPQSPVKKGPLRALNDGGPGRKVMQMFAAGMLAGEPLVTDAFAAATSNLTPGALPAATLPGVIDASGAAPVTMEQLMEVLRSLPIGQVTVTGAEGQSEYAIGVAAGKTLEFATRR